MKTKSLLLIICMLSFITYAEAAKKEKGNKKLITKEITIQDFNNVVIKDRITSNRNIFNRHRVSVFNYDQTSGSSSLQITIDENLFDLLAFEEENGQLTITTKDKDVEIAPSQLIIHGKSSSLQNVKIEGVMDFTSNNHLKADSLSFEMSGIGDITLANISGDQLKCSISGIGNINIAGNVNEAAFHVEGIGKVWAYDCLAKEVRGSLDGIGKMHIYGSEKISAEVSGIGKIHYKGNAQVVDRSTSGIGKIRRAD